MTHGEFDNQISKAAAGWVVIGLMIGQFQLGPEVSATIWDDATASAGLPVSYVIGGSNQ